MCIKTRKEFVVCEQLSAIKKQKDNLEWKVVWIFEITNKIKINSLRLSTSYVIKTRLIFDESECKSFIIEHLMNLEYILNYSPYTINHVALHISFT